MSSQQLDEEAIFHIARQLVSTDARATYLDQVCAGDQHLRERVEALLEVHQNEQEFLKSDPDAAPTLDHTPLTERPGTSVGRYRLMEQIGEGGMGTVFVAEQERPIRRKVALKVIKPGMDSKAVVARFEAERQALALMDHPNIAKVLDAGTTDSGRPYFVMELVRGIPITEYCDEHKLTIRERLELFTQVCQAIQHAHQKAIIHRDIKPTNVLVTEQDGKPVPKVIDFGVAKALNRRLTERTIYTTFAQVVGTPLYMSPEQAALSAVDVDTRSDVYSLGVLLYELLTGTTPFDRERFEQAAYDEIRRIVREEEPPKPSTKISTLGDERITVAQNRRTDQDKLGRVVRGDLDWIVMKALDKERGRRYETASSLAGDVARYLGHETVAARPPSTAYLLRKFLGRNRVLVSATAAVAATLLLGTIVSVALAIQARYQRDQAETARLEAENTLTRLQEELQAKAIMYAMNLDRERMRQAVRDSGATDGWAKMIEAIPALFSGNIGEAEELLQEAKRLGEDTLSTQALTSLAKACNADVMSYLEAGEALRKTTPHRPQDKVFCALAAGGLDGVRSLDWASQAFDEVRSPVALMVVAQARTFASGDKGDIEQAELATIEAQAALSFMPDSPFAMHACLFAHYVALVLADEANDRSRVHYHTEAGKKLAGRLDAHPQHGWGQLVAAEFYEEIGEPAEVKKRYELLMNLGTGNYFKQKYVDFLYRQDELSRAREVMNRVPPDPLNVFMLSLMLAENRETRVQARDLLMAQLDETKSNLLTPGYLSLLSQIGFPDVAKTLAMKLIESTVVRDFDPFAREQLLYIAGQSEDEQLLNEAGSSRIKSCTAHLLIAYRALANGNRELASDHLRRCRGFPGDPETRTAKETLRRMEDPTWPYWMTEGM